MERLERSEKEYGGGSGKTSYESDLFRVVKWRLKNGDRTVISSNHYGHISAVFDGWVDFESDQDCFDQLTADEIKSMIEEAFKSGVENGEKAKERAFREVLGIENEVFW